MNKPKISVIIPVYNAGNRLKVSLNSLVSQTLREIEFICVLDCPTDGSGVVVKEYALHYPNFIVIENDHNLNIGESRNKGLEVAKGDYVAFCDHDDIVEPFMYERMYERAVFTNSDIVLGVPEYTYIDNSQNKTYYYPSYDGDIKEKVLSLIIGNDHDDKKWGFYFSHGVIWANLYRRSFLYENEIKFVDNNRITFEDNIFSIETLYNAKNVVVYNELVYHHVIDGNNTASSPNYVKLPLIIGYIHYLYDYLICKELLSRTKKRFSNTVIMYITGAVVTIIKTNRWFFWRSIATICQIRQDDIIKESFKGGSMIPRSNRFAQDIALRFINIIMKL